MILASCSSTNSTDVAAPQNTGTSTEKALIDKIGAERYEALLKAAANGKAGDQVQGDITYLADLCDGSYYGDVTQYSFGDPDEWDFYRFYGEAGSEVSITVNRTSCIMDPAFTLYSGSGTTTTGLGYNYGNSELTYIGYWDDDFTPTVGCGYFADPRLINYTLPSTGWYTIAVWDAVGAYGGTPEYELVVSGIVCDADGDGVNDDEDPYPNSDDQATVSMDGCDSGVENKYLGDGTYMMDLINDCRDNATNHGGFVSCLSALTNGWKAEGLITGAQKGSISSCGANANWP